MMEKIFISVEKSSRMISLTKKYIGNDLENLQQELVFKFTDEFVNGSARLEYQVGNNKYHIPMTKDGETYTVAIKNVITKEGRIPMQLVIVQTAQDEEIPVFKSNVFDMYCNKSINAQEEAPDDYEYWLDVIQTKLADIDDALEQVDNLDINATKIGKVATVSITNKDGITKSVEITDGTDGEKGETGPANTLVIGTVVKGDEANASITGDAPNQTLNLVLPKGDKGEKGDTGNTGATGPSNVLSIGTVTKGGNASATITGTSPNQVLNLVLPKGDKGDTGEAGPQGNPGANGTNGQDGFSPIATVTQTQSGATISITDKNGTTTANVTNGQDGEEYDDTELRGLIAEKQDELVSGTNIKTINNTSILGSGNIDIQGGGTSDYSDLTNKPLINNVTLSGNKTSSNLGLQDILVSGTNIKTINNTSLLGSGNIEVLTKDKLFESTTNENIQYYYSGIKSLEGVEISDGEESISLIDALEIIAIRPYSGDENKTIINQVMEFIVKYLTVPASVKEDSIFIVEMPGIMSAMFQLDSEDNTRIDRMWVVNHGWDFAPYTLEASGSINYVTINVMYIGQNILVSGTNIKTINNTSILGSGNIDIDKSNIYVGPDEPTDDSTVWVDTDEPEPTIPTKTSQLSNDSDFVNSGVNTLQNYYNKMSMDKMIEDIWDMLGGSLPAGYTKVEYLQGSGNQYIDLGFVPHTGIVAKGKYTGFTQPMPLGIATPMGVMSSSSNRFDMFSFGTTSIDSVMTPVFGLGYVSYHFTSTPIVQGKVYEVEAALKNGEQYLKVDGNTIFTNNVSGSIEAAANMLMFNRYKNGELDTGWYEGKIYYTKIWQDNVFIRDMIPCLDNNGTPCFYDRVNKQTYYNEGTGEFIYGPVVIPSSYTRCKYLESTGTQYIDTELIATTNTGISIDYSYNQIDTNTSAGLTGIFKNTNPREDTLFISTSIGKTDSAVCLFSRGTTLNTGITLETNKMYNAKINWLNNNKLDFDNGTSISDVGTNNVISRNIILFGRDSGGTYAFTKARIYSCKFSENNIITHDLIPCLDSTNTPCFYDVITKQTYYNAGTGTFTYEVL